jgi:hypothetical protein
MPDTRVTMAITVLAALGAAGAHGPHQPRHGDGLGVGIAPAVAPTVAAAVTLGAGEHVYESVPNWCRLPDERPLGNTHGSIVIDEAGQVYFNTDTDRSIMVYTPGGRFVRSLAADFPAIHGMTLREEDGETFIYAAHLRGKQVLKLKLDGSVVWALPVPTVSGKYDDDPRAYNPTSVAVAPNGDVFVADGYGRNWIHHYSKDKKWIRSFGGPGEEPGTFRTCHGIAIDTRGPTPRLLVCDRENRRLQRFDLEGNFIDVVATGLRRPCAVAFHGRFVAVAELEGRVTILDERFETVAHLGDNPRREHWANNGVKPEEWIDGVFTAPHGCCFDAEGNLYVMDWNATGRISKLRRK